jgi:hypothetical protein
VDNLKIEELLKKNIEASNRTTHAVRAFVSFVLIQLMFVTIAAFLSILAATFSATWLFGLAVIVWIVGVFLSSNAGWSELKDSEIPLGQVPEVGRARNPNTKNGGDSQRANGNEKLPRNLKLDSNMRLVCKNCGNWELVENGRCTACN